MELMIVVAIIGILSAVATPFIQQAYGVYQARGAARNLVALFQQARLEAIRSGQNVVINITPGAFVPQGRVGTVVAFVDDNGDWAQAAPAERSIFNMPMPSRVSLTGVTVPQLAFNSRGLPINNVGGFAGTTINMEGGTTRPLPGGLPGQTGYQVVLSTAGYVRLR
jgi:Tfp pilus assembly protein FimT